MVARVLDHEGLVVHLAEQFYRRSIHGKYRDELADFVQEGQLGLMIAAGWEVPPDRPRRGGPPRRKPYDPERASFATYASYWIKQRLGMAMTNGGQLNRRLEQQALHGSKSIRPTSKIVDFKPTEDVDAVDRLRSALAKLSDLEREIVCRRFGIDHALETPEEIARTIGRDYRAVWRIEQRAVKKLREIMSQGAA